MTTTADKIFRAWQSRGSHSLLWQDSDKVLERSQGFLNIHNNEHLLFCTNKQEIPLSLRNQRCSPIFSFEPAHSCNLKTLFLPCPLALGYKFSRRQPLSQHRSYTVRDGTQCPSSWRNRLCRGSTTDDRQWYYSLIYTDLPFWFSSLHL